MSTWMTPCPQVNLCLIEISWQSSQPIQHRPGRISSPTVPLSRRRVIRGRREQRVLRALVRPSARLALMDLMFPPFRVGHTSTATHRGWPGVGACRGAGLLRALGLHRCHCSSHLPGTLRPSDLATILRGLIIAKTIPQGSQRERVPCRVPGRWFYMVHKVARTREHHSNSQGHKHWSCREGGKREEQACRGISQGATIQ